ncbi:MAG: hypothetical protein JWM71_2212 [Solirubrobacteraceae bacterium]|nr:hypothetical protein [Solirubrobacteraceae bacterium]
MGTRAEHVDGHHEERPGGTLLLADASVACPSCDAPVALATARAAPRDPLACPFCAHAGAVRDFLSFAVPTRPARVRVWVRNYSCPAGRGGPDSMTPRISRTRQTSRRSSSTSTQTPAVRGKTT